jgi:hypothetical protein
MYGFLLAMALAASADTSVLSSGDLDKAIDAAGQGPPATLEGRRFRIVLPVVSDRPQTLRNFQSSARWRYRPGQETLEIWIGLGQITPQNYDQYAKQGLGTLPPLQTLYFKTDEHRSSTVFNTKEMLGEKQETGDRRVAVSYGLALPYAEDGASSGLPKGFLPSMVYKTRLESRYLSPTVDGMTLEVSGVITALGERPNVLCGGFAGGVTASSATGDTPIWIENQQCFVTARIDTAVVKSKAGRVLARWGDVSR